MAKELRKLILIIQALYLVCAATLSANAFGMDYPNTLSESEKIEVLWGRYLEGNLDPIAFFFFYKSLDLKRIGVAQGLRLEQMKASFGNDGRVKELRHFDELEPDLALRIAAEREFLTNFNFSFGDKAIRALRAARIRLEQQQLFRKKTKDEIIDLVFESPSLESVETSGSSYGGGFKLFLLCRRDRSYPCLFFMKNASDRLVREEDGSLWTLPALAMSAGNIPYHTTNGHTPSGVHTIDSVMPWANRQEAFGKFRRLILNWLPNAKSTKSFLPESARQKRWWKQASIARDNGRKWLRIHGTGRVNRDEESSHYPHSPTEGCVSVREGTYNNTEFTDQRKLLDKAMEAMELQPLFKNEPNLKGVLFVIELDEKEERVSKETLKDFGIF